MRVQVDAGEVRLLLLPLLGQRLQLWGLQRLQAPGPLGQPGCALSHRRHARPRACAICNAEIISSDKGWCLLLLIGMVLSVPDPTQVRLIDIRWRVAPPYLC